MRFRIGSSMRALWAWTAAVSPFLMTALGGGVGFAADPGEIVGWGSDSYGQASPPVGRVFVAIAGGGEYSVPSHSLALKSDGSVVGWGGDFDGQASPPAGTDFTAIAAGGRHSLGLKSDGSIVGWGWDYYGQTTPPAGTDFTAIAAGGNHSLGLKSDGSIVAWGQDVYGEVSNTPTSTDFIAIAAGTYYGLALKSDGSIVGWGSNFAGETTVPAGTDFTAIAAGGYHGLGLKSDGSIVGWGANSEGQATPPAGTDFTAIAAGGYFSLGLKSDGSIVGWGSNGDGRATPPTGTDYFDIAAGTYHGLGLRQPRSIPGLLNYQGRLNNSSGDALDGVLVNLTFRFYDDHAAGSPLLTVEQTDVQVTEGLFNVLIGSGTVTAGSESTLGDLFRNHRSVWMSTEVGSDGEMTLRKPIASVGYATIAGSAADLTRVVPRFVAPENPSKGMVYMDDTTNTLMVFDGSIWQACW